jgi:ATP-binding cassette subfamily B protein
MEKKPSIISLLKPYRGLIGLLLVFTLISNGINLFIPQIIAGGIDAFTAHNFAFKALIIKFSLAVFAIFIFAYLQSIIQTYASERVARDLRTRLSDKISQQSYAFIEQVNPSKLLTNLTADVDSIKMFVSQAIVSIVSSIFIIGLMYYGYHPHYWWYIFRCTA